MKYKTTMFHLKDEQTKFAFLLFQVCFKKFTNPSMRLTPRKCTLSMLKKNPALLTVTMVREKKKPPPTDPFFVVEILPFLKSVGDVS